MLVVSALSISMTVNLSRIGYEVHILFHFALPEDRMHAQLHPISNYLALKIKELVATTKYVSVRIGQLH